MGKALLLGALVVLIAATFAAGQEAATSQTGVQTSEAIEAQEQLAVACYILVVLKQSKDEGELAKLNLSLNEIPGERADKIKAIMMSKCLEEIPTAVIEKMIYQEVHEMIHPSYEPYVQIDYTELIKPGFIWNLTVSDRKAIERFIEASKIVEEASREQEQPEIAEQRPGDRNEEDNDNENENESENENDENQGEENDPDEVSISSLLAQRKKIGEKKYRIALCYFFARKAYLNKRILKAVVPNRTVTEARKTKVLALMLNKCVSTFPIKIHSQEEEEAMGNYVKYISLGEEELGKSNFLWKATPDEKKLVKSAAKMVLRIEEEQKNADETVQRKKRLTTFSSWVRKNTRNVVTFCCVVVALVFIFGLFYYRKKTAQEEDIVDDQSLKEDIKHTKHD